MDDLPKPMESEFTKQLLAFPKINDDMRADIKSAFLENKMLELGRSEAAFALGRPFVKSVLKDLEKKRKKVFVCCGRLEEALADIKTMSPPQKIKKLNRGAVLFGAENVRLSLLEAELFALKAAMEKDLLGTGKSGPQSLNGLVTYVRETIIIFEKLWGKKFQYYRRHGTDVYLLEYYFSKLSFAFLNERVGKADGVIQRSEYTFKNWTTVVEQVLKDR